MARLVKKLILLVAGAALVAAALLLWASPDPDYRLHSWLAMGRFTEYDALIADASRRHGVDPLLVKAVVWRESAFDPTKVGTSGERGLMQVGEAAAQDWARVEKIETFVPTDLFDPKTNIEVGTWYLGRALEWWKARANPVPFGLAEYNAGRTRVDRWIGITGQGEAATAEQLMDVIDFPTTKRYIEDITARHRFYQQTMKP
jgi:soluble lytic murein transglycosylase